MTSGTLQHLTIRQAWLLSAVTGFLALGWEIVWMRLYNVATSSRAIAFGMMLGAYLLGLALGSLWSRHWQKKGRGTASPVQTLAGLIQWANLGAFLVVPLVSWMVLAVNWQWTLPVVAISAALLGTILPMVCHLAIPPDSLAGRRMGGIYLANILGSGAGSLLTGFVLMEHVPIVWLCVIFLCLGHAVVLALRWKARVSVGWQRTLAFWGLACAVVVLGYQGVWERLHYRDKYDWGMRIPRVIESRHGVILVEGDGTIYGNGAYDGTLETQLKSGSWLVRPYFISALHPKPERVLVIGVSGGAWTQILAHHPDVREVIGVEISEPYLRLIKESPSVASLHQNPKVKLVIDDGRRWLRRNPHERFDLIVMNTTHHWREFASALLSREFLELAQSHLKEGGLVAWNTTDSARATKTGLSVFPHSALIINFMVGSNSPIQPDKARWKRLLELWQIDGVPVFDLQSPNGREDLEACVGFFDLEGPKDQQQPWRWTTRQHLEAAFGGSEVEVITDDNLGHEFDRGNW